MPAETAKREPNAPSPSVAADAADSANSGEGRTDGKDCLAGDVVIYDGACPFCCGQIDRLRRLDRGGRLAFVPSQDPLVRERFPDLTAERLQSEMVVVDRHGRRHGGADAVRYLSRRLPRLWWVMPVLHVPGTMPLWRWLYRWVARRRYRLSGSGGRCEEGTCRWP